MWVGNLLAATRPRKLPSSASTGNDVTKRGSPRTAMRRKPLSSERRKPPMSARQRRVALSRIASKMGCKSCGELAMARSTSNVTRRPSASVFDLLQATDIPPARIFGEKKPMATRKDGVNSTRQSRGEMPITSAALSVWHCGQKVESDGAQRWLTEY